jgi:hypothetical protein
MTSGKKRRSNWVERGPHGLIHRTAARAGVNEWIDNRKLSTWLENSNRSLRATGIAWRIGHSDNSRLVP